MMQICKHEQAGGHCGLFGTQCSGAVCPHKESTPEYLELLQYRASGLSPQVVMELSKAISENRMILLPCTPGAQLFYVFEDDDTGEICVDISYTAEQFLATDGRVLIGTGDGTFDDLADRNLFLSLTDAVIEVERLRMGERE